jgi:hypothetical protein
MLNIAMAETSLLRSGVVLLGGVERGHHA